MNVGLIINGNNYKYIVMPNGDFIYLVNKKIKDISNLYLLYDYESLNYIEEGYQRYEYEGDGIDTNYYPSSYRVQLNNKIYDEFPDDTKDLILNLIADNYNTVINISPINSQNLKMLSADLMKYNN